MLARPLPTVNDLGALRLRAARFFAVLLWVHIPVIALIARSNHLPVLPSALAMIAAAAVGTTAALLWGGDVRARCTIAAALTVAPALMVYVGEGPWEVDWHMYFFVVFGMLVAFVDWRPIAVSATLTALHHVLLAAVFPIAVFPDSDFARVGLHAALVVGDALVLFWIVRHMRALFSQSQGALDIAKTALDRAELLQSAVVNANDAFVISRMDSTSGLDAAIAGRRIVYTNAAFERMTGYSSAEVEGKSPQLLSGKKTDVAELGRSFAALLDGKTARFVGTFYAKDGREIDVEVSISAVPRTLKGSFLTIAVLHDVTASRHARETLLRAELAEENYRALQNEIDERKIVEQQLAFAAGHDSLTGLPNRSSFREMVARALGENASPAGEHAVLLLDVDRFKSVNDGLGHAAGDALLVAIASRLSTCLREHDLLARLDGDTFVILVKVGAEDAELDGIAQRLLASFATPFDLATRDVHATASIGIARRGSCTDADDLIRNADLAMYQAKSLGKARYHTYVPELLERSARLSRIESDLQRAVVRGEIDVFYQPIVLLGSERIRGFEALVRWQHPSVGLISPTEFIPIAESIGLIVDLGAQVLETACARLRAWLDAFPTHAGLWVSVNVSPLQLRSTGYLESVLVTLKRHALSPHYLHLEITESTIVSNFETISPTLTSLRDRGVHISIDDFGTGYSSLEYLDMLPVDTLKIDRSFVSGRGDGIANIKIVRTIVNFANDLGLAVITEGIETAEQAETMRVLTHSYGQGYYFGKALDDVATLRLLEAAALDAEPSRDENGLLLGRANFVKMRKPA